MVILFTSDPALTAGSSKRHPPGPDSSEQRQPEQRRGDARLRPSVHSMLTPIAAASAITGIAAR